MTIEASIQNTIEKNTVIVSTNDIKKQISIPPKPGGGSSVNGGELLFLALATCFCNDIYREAGKRKMSIQAVDVFVTGQFGKEGEAGSNISYQVKIEAPDHTDQQIQELISYVDEIAEIHNTLRQGVSVTLNRK